MNLHQSREAFLREQPDLVGQSWATEWLQTMRSEGRRVTGGWPGTVPEARALAQDHFERELRSRRMPQLNPEELAQVTALVYERARTEWRLAMQKG